MSDTVSITCDDLEALMRDAMLASNIAEPAANAVANALLMAEIDGRKGHGLSRVPSYSAQALSGKVDGKAVPQLEQSGSAALRIDVAHGFFYPAMELAAARLPELAKSAGIAAAGFHRSHHCGVVGHQVERLADAGLLAILVANTPEAMAPTGGKRPVFGTNPIAFAAPRRGSPSVVVDMALSQVARGNILTASQAGKPIPEGWAYDRDGNPTTDPDAALQGGTLLPVGGAKGAALALMVELLAGALTGSNLSTEATSFFTGDGPPPSVGQFLIVVDPGSFAGNDRYLDRAADVFESIESQDGARLPGERRMALRTAAKENGLTVPSALLNDVKEIAAVAKP